MKLLIITQVIDSEHPILGFFHRWVEEFAKHYEQVHVICLQVGKHSFPTNVTVHSLGKEKGEGRLIYICRFYLLIFKLRHEYDHVFVHMNQIYVVLGGLLWRTLGKKNGLWYVHRQITLSLRVACLFATKVFTSSPESFRIKTKKAVYLGHGIDIERFKNTSRRIRQKNEFNVVHIGRITKIKNLDVLVEAARFLKTDSNVRFHLYGPANTDAERDYKEYLVELITKYKVNKFFVFHEPVRNDLLSDVFSQTDVTVNLTPTGGMDKAVIESMAAGVPLLVSNEAFMSTLKKDWTLLHVPFRDHQSLVSRLNDLQGLSDSDYSDIQDRLKYYSMDFSVSTLIKNISQLL